MGQCLSSAGEPKIGQSTSDVVLEILNRGGKIPSLNLLAAYLLIQLRMLLTLLQENTAESSSACCPPGLPGFFSTELFSRQPVPSQYHCKELLCPRDRTWQNLMRCPSAHFSNVGKSVWIAASSIPAAPDNLVSTADLLRTQCPPLICEAIQHFVGDYQVSQKKFTLGRSLLTIDGSSFQEDLLHNLLRTKAQWTQP